MKYYNPKIKDSFVMQFGFTSPNWTRAGVNNLELQQKSKNKKKNEVLRTE
tara:strand:+ start:38 stop:187 length:150 start_codon:yes stop_codon:yes gene_type:complete